MIEVMQPYPPTTFRVVDITGWEAEDPEKMGARDKLWVMADPLEVVDTHLW